MSSCVSVFVLTLIDFTVLSFPWASWLMSQLVTRLADQDSGERCIQEEAYVHVACTCRRRTDHNTLLGYGGVVSLDQLVDESGELCLVVQDLPSLHWEGTGIPIQGGGLGRWGTVSSGEMEWAHQHYPILSYNQVILLGQPSYPLIQIGEIKLSIGDGDERSSMMWVDEFNIINNQLISPRKSIPTLISHQSGNKKKFIQL